MIDDTLGTTTSDWRRTMDTRYDTSSFRSHGVSDTVLSWFAFGAVVFGVIGAITGAMSSTRRRASSWRIPGDPYALTPPHGDKLHLRY